MPEQVAILHGWSDDSKSFRPLARFLEENGYEAVPLWLGDYISMSDEVRIEDVAKRMQEVIEAKKREGLGNTFDLIVHSTGGLVARSWISTYYPDGAGCPVKRLLMLAPANFGSRLATAGKSLLGRVFKGWGHGFQTGREMLTALELASPFQWDLAQRDLFVPEVHDGAPSPYGEDGVWPFVIVGSHPYPSGPRTLVNENGSDGTVRVAAANLNVRGITIDFTRDVADPDFSRPWPTLHAPDSGFPLAVLPDRDHGTIILPDTNELDYEGPDAFSLPTLLLEALRCEDRGAYEDIRKMWFDVSEDTARLGSADNAGELRARFPRRQPDPEFFHQYVQVVVRVVDDHGTPVDDYFIEFFGRRERRSDEALYFHSQVLENVHPKSQVATRCLFIDRTDLMDTFYGLIGDDHPKELHATISAARPGPHVRYFAEEGVSAEGSLVIHRHAEEDGRWLKRNSTHFVKIIIPRVPADEVFTLTRNTTP